MPLIGVFDSGVGGLSVLREIRVLLPDADMLYLADQARAPYGDRSQDDVRTIAGRAAEFLIEAGAETVVVACNTASAAALHWLRQRRPETVFVGMEPAVKPAARVTASGVVGVLVTPSTFQTRVVADLAERFADGVTVITRACPGLADAVERLDDPGTAVADHVEALVASGADAIVIGCTHYSFLADSIRGLAGAGVTVIDPAPAVARQVARVAPGTGAGATRYLTTGDPARFADQVGRLLGVSIVADRVSVGEGSPGN
jgi:glutamate racemase